VTFYAIVQHSGYAWGEDPTFAKAVEQIGVSTKQAEAVVALGGRVFDNYMDADRFAEAENYPPTVFGLIPAAPGTFTDAKVNDLPVYKPVAA
jgi:hypothetical protein